jgi:hypothetical protein
MTTALTSYPPVDAPFARPAASPTRRRLSASATGGLLWPLQRSGVELRGSRDGAIATPHGIWFPAAGSPAESPVTARLFGPGARFRGAVTAGANHVVLCDPGLDHDHETGWLTVADPDWAGERLAIATFELPHGRPADARHWTGAGVHLTADGAELFGGTGRLADFVITLPEPARAAG